MLKAVWGGGACVLIGFNPKLNLVVNSDTAIKLQLWLNLMDARSVMNLG